MKHKESMLALNAYYVFNKIQRVSYLATVTTTIVTTSRTTAMIQNNKTNNINNNILILYFTKPKTQMLSLNKLID